MLRFLISLLKGTLVTSLFTFEHYLSFDARFSQLRVAMVWCRLLPVSHVWGNIGIHGNAVNSINPQFLKNTPLNAEYFAVLDHERWNDARKCNSHEQIRLPFWFSTWATKDCSGSKLDIWPCAGHNTLGEKISVALQEF